MDSNIDTCPGYSIPTNIAPSKKDYAITATRQASELTDAPPTQKTLTDLLFPKTLVQATNLIVRDSSRSLIKEAQLPSSKKEQLLLELGLNKQRLLYQDAQLELLKFFLQKYALLGEKAPIEQTNIDAFLKLNDPETGPLSDIHFVKLCLKNNKY